jgi:hypothetical protein
LQLPLRLNWNIQTPIRKEQNYSPDCKLKVQDSFGKSSFFCKEKMGDIVFCETTN